MTAALAVLIIAVVVLAVDKVLISRQHANEVHSLLDDVRVANRAAVRAAMARTGLDFDRAESLAAAYDERARMQTVPVPREPDPAPEGLG